MAKLYYGGGSCTIEGSGIRGVQIKYRGAIEIDDKTTNSFAIAHQNNGIMIFPIGEGTLNDLFNYTGEFKITSVIAADNNGKGVAVSVRRVMDYTELLNTKAEDMTTKSEDLSATHISGRKVDKTRLKQPNINNQHTSRHDGELYLKDGTLYEGSYHIHLDNNSAMTGGEHTKASQSLYFANGKPTKNPTSVPYGAIEKNKRRKKVKTKSRVSRRRSSY